MIVVKILTLFNPIIVLADLNWNAFEYKDAILQVMQLRDKICLIDLFLMQYQSMEANLVSTEEHLRLSEIYTVNLKIICYTTLT